MKETTKTSRTAEEQMELKEIVTKIRKEALKLSMEIDEYIEWIRAESNKRLPWEE